MFIKIAKKIIQVFVVLFMVLLVLGSGLGLVLYYKGLSYGMDELRKIAKTQFNTEILNGRVGFIERRGLFIEDLIVRQDTWTLSIQRIQLFADWDRKQKVLHLRELHLTEPKFHCDLKKSEIKDSQVSEANKGAAAFEDFLEKPPTAVVLHRIRVERLQVQCRIQKSGVKSSSSSPIIKRLDSIVDEQRVEFSDLNLELESQLKPQNLILKMHLVLNEKLHWQNQSQNQSQRLSSPLTQKIQVHKIISDLRWVVQKTAAGRWDYDFLFENLEIAMGPWSIESSGILQGQDLQFQLKGRIQAHSQKALDPKSVKVDEIQWTLDSKAQGITGKGHKGFQFLAAKGVEGMIHTSGSLKSVFSSAQTLDLPWAWVLDFKLTGGPFVLKGVQSKVALDGKWENNRGQVALRTLGSRYLRGQGRAEIFKHQALLQGFLEAHLPPGFMEVLIKKKLEGHVHLPLTFLVRPLNASNVKEILFETTVDFAKVDFKSDQFQILGLSGQLPVRERFFWNSHKSGLEAFELQGLRTQNPFESADYERLDPLIRSLRGIRIEQLRWEGVAFGPFQGVLDVEQNLFSIHQFALDFKQGTAGGEFFFDLNPSNARLGFLGRLTKIDLKSILPPRFLNSTQRALPISARTGFLLQLKRKTLEGRMDVTEVGADQLTAIMSVLDPRQENEKMNKTRSLLQYGYPKSVGLFFHDGALDMEIDISAMGLTTHQSMQGILIQSFIDKALEGQKESL